MKWIVGVLLIAVVMGLAAIATIPAAAISLEDAALKFLPPETQGVAFVDVDALLRAPLVQEALKARPVDYPQAIKEFMAATGIDPQRDLAKVTIAKISNRDALVIAQGRIDKFKVEQFLKDKGAETEVYLGQTMYRDREGAVAVFDNVAIAGQSAAVKRAIDQMQIPGAQPLRSELLAAMQTIEAGNQIWAVGDLAVTDLDQMGVRGPVPVLDMLKSLKGGTFQMRIDNDVHARGTANFTDPKNAQDLSDMARGLLAIAKLQVAQKQPDLLRLLDGIQVSSSGSTLTVKIEESGEMLKKLKDFRPASVLGQ